MSDSLKLRVREDLQAEIKFYPEGITSEQLYTEYCKNHVYELKGGETFEGPLLSREVCLRVSSSTAPSTTRTDNRNRGGK